MNYVTHLIYLCLISILVVGCAERTVDGTPETGEMVVGVTPEATVVTCTDENILAQPQMVSRRAAHTATLLPDGTVLLVGGFIDGEKGLSSAEIFDPQSNLFRQIESMSVGRQSHTATLLADGRVLILGGFNEGNYLATAELYDPQTGRFADAGSMIEGRSGHQAVMLADGTILIVGGVGRGWRFLATAELYDPESGRFTAVGSMSVARESHTATLLRSGEVLISGGHEGRRSEMVIYETAELYDPMQQIFVPVGEMVVKRHKHDATLLGDGTVLITGGADERDAQGAYRSSELYDPVTKEFQAGPMMGVTHYKHAGSSLLLADGQVLVVGGGSASELYDGGLGEFREIGGAIPARFFGSATLLVDGRVLFAGGYGRNIAASDQAWLLSACLR